jgi:predicted nucleic acid-binding protein
MRDGERQFCARSDAEGRFLTLLKRPGRRRPIAGQPEDALFTTTICQAEILAGLPVMPEGRRRVALETAARAIFADDFNGRVLPFDAAAAAAYVDIFAARRRTGRPAAPLDLMVVAIARANGAGVVTRDIGGFEDCGVPLVDLWQALS